MEEVWRIETSEVRQKDRKRKYTDALPKWNKNNESVRYDIVCDIIQAT